MSFQKQPKQKSNYPGMLEGFEKKRFRDWRQAKQKIKPTFNLHSGFTPGSRKVPN